ncbi:5-formyltetrahydrofolate cyclo-ligase [Bacillus subtilis]|uniref:5-formyltetrahydrofolate cyclo-ligase n=1 Tax=Pseudochrobactrum asaccharolyticum TaxID=354351 RepID=UPI001F031DCA|nr:5-formyltetrahydrofolate cyclo-ligase [Pseudochrobactrum asaccharolyticum]MCF7646217.1 5-formyltetrahydrofolate cyclo-ligase [Pseudochrobactrum asaccharolyticum]MCF7672964.1 5-formyltetrahydrofolate cyclo-ligase [Bacillus subtilis]
MQSEDLKAGKAALRKSVFEKRNALSVAYRQEVAQAIMPHFFNTITLPARSCISGFWPIRSEIDPRPLMRELEAQGMTLCVPAILDAQTIEFRAMSFGDVLVETGFGTMGPPADAPVVDPDIMLIPLAAFDRAGNRIGYGAGYYDRAIAALHQKNKHPVLIGVAFDAQRVDHIAHEPHDVALDYILTETGLIAASPQG